MNGKMLPVVLLGIAMTDCGGMKAPDTAAYQRLSGELSAAVENHRAASANLTAANCPAERDRYGTQARPLLERMASMTAEMDAHMRDMGHGGLADMQSTCRSMSSELESHLASACSAGTIAGEATRHATAMKSMLQHETDRASNMQYMMPRGLCH